jgi:hypothetical protein
MYGLFFLYDIIFFNNLNNSEGWILESPFYYIDYITF